MSDFAIDPAAFAEVNRLLSDPVALAGKIQELLTAFRAEQAAKVAAIDAATERALAARVALDAGHAERVRALERAEANNEVWARELMEQKQRLAAREAALERSASWNVLGLA